VIHNVMAYEICHGDPINLLVVLLLPQYKIGDVENHIKTKSLHIDTQTDYSAYESLISITESHQSIAQDLSVIEEILGKLYVCLQQ
jgi:hypothetical protein